MASRNGMVMEHRFVMAQHLGRPLLPGEVVHHRNGIRSDNSLDNLELWTTSHPKGQRVEEKLRWAREFVALYGGSTPGREVAGTRDVLPKAIDG